MRLFIIAASMLALAGCGNNATTTSAPPIVAGTYQSTPVLNPHFAVGPVVTVTDLGGGLFRCDLHYTNQADRSITLPVNVLTFSDDGKHSYWLGSSDSLGQFLDIDHIRYALNTPA